MSGRSASSGPFLTRTRTLTIADTAITNQENGDVTVTFPGALTSDSVFVSPASALPNGLVVSSVRVSAADTVAISFGNYSAAPVQTGALDFLVTLMNQPPPNP